MSEQLLQQIISKLNRIDHEQQSLKQELQDYKHQAKNNFEIIKQELQIFRLQTKNGFNEVMNDLRIIKEQTALNTELSSPINDLQERINNIELDIKLLKRILHK